jgi:hypothetical protein
MFKKLLILSLTLAASMHSECTYLEPEQTTQSGSFFQQLIDRSNRRAETFQTVLAFFNHGKTSVHRFNFEYPIGDAESFFRVLEIKAQEAHRFIPIFTHCQFLSPQHLGFLRKAVIANGPALWEHILVDKKSKSVLFIEEREVFPNGEEIAGCFAALNTVVERDGHWFFSGTYLYAQRPSSEDIQETKLVFQHTYENMIAFLKSGQIDSIYDQLQEY